MTAAGPGSRMARGFAAVLILAAAAALGAEVVDRIAAVVGSEVITERELNQAYSSDELGLMKPDPLSGNSAQTLTREQYLERLIERKVIEQEVKRQGIRVDALEVEKAIDRKRESLGMTEDEFQRALALQGISLDEYRDKVREQLITFRLISQEVKGEIEVTEDEVRAYYQMHPEKFMEKDRLHLLHIFISAPEGSGDVGLQAAFQQLDQLRSQIEAGSDFAEMARQYSRAPTASSGGDLGWFSLEELLPEFKDQVENLQPGQMSPVFIHQNGAHLIWLEEVRKGSRKPLPEVHDKIKDLLFQEKAMARYDLWLARLKARIHIENRLQPESP